MAVKIVSTKDAAILHGVKAVIYGRAGHGKTTLASTAPSPIILSAESGLLSLRRFDLPVIVIETLADLVEAHGWLEESTEARQFQTVFVDSSTEIAEKILANAKATVKDPRQAYQELSEKANLAFKSLRDLSGYHVVLTAKQESAKDDVTGAMMFGPMMPGRAMGQQLPYLFDEMFHLGIGRTLDGSEYRYLRTQPDFQYDAKDRSGCLDAIEQPNLTYIFDKILKS